jgi:hypothetical protein
LLVLALILAGCGGAGNSKWQQVQGRNFLFQAPAAWAVVGTAASKGRVDRVQVSEFRLLHAYKRSELAAATKELDGVATRLAQQLKGRVAGKRTLEVGGYDARMYAIDHDSLTEEITFVLQGPHEYELLCRRAQRADDSACRELIASFRLS